MKWETTVAEWIAMRHQIRVSSDYRGYQATCTCNRFRSRWQPTFDEAMTRGVSHLAHATKKQEKWRRERDQAREHGQAS